MQIIIKHVLFTIFRNTGDMLTSYFILVNIIKKILQKWFCVNTLNIVKTIFLYFQTAVLKDILGNDSLKLDAMFKDSLIIDIIRVSAINKPTRQSCCMFNPEFCITFHIMF